MGRADRDGKLPRRVTKVLDSSKAKGFPKVFLDIDTDFASIKLAPGIEAKSYIKDGVLFSEDAKGRIIEIQILNVGSKPQKAKKSKRAV